MKQKHWILLGIFLLTILVYLLPAPPGLSDGGNLGLTVLVFAGSLWVLEPLPLQVTGLIIPVSLVATGLLSAEEAFAPFAAPVVFLILGSLFLAEALRKHGITRRIALDLIVRCKGNPKLLLLTIMIVAGLTSMWIFSTAVVAMLMPVCLTIATRVAEDNRQRFVTVLLMALVFSSTLGALSTILGASSNAVASGALAQQISWSFLDWMKYGTPLAFVFLPLTWLILIVTVYPDIERIDTDVVEEQLQDEGELSGAEKGIFYVLLSAIFLWVIGPYINDYLFFPDDLTNSAIISLCAAGVLFGTEIITWQDARQVNWGVYLIIGAGLSLGKGLHVSGLSDWFATSLAYVIQGSPYLIMMAVLIPVTALLSNTVNNTTVVAILAPVMADAAASLSLSVTQLMLPMAFGATFGFLLPAASSRMALAYASGNVDAEDMIKIGSIVTFPLLALTVLYFYLLFNLGLI
jgi:sodium-dependent dicarboxylate transporter 2/3/5